MQAEQQLWGKAERTVLGVMHTVLSARHQLVGGEKHPGVKWEAEGANGEPLSVSAQHHPATHE